METKENKKIGVWMDQRQAFLVTCENKQASLKEKIESPIESMVRYPGETDSKTKMKSNYAASNNEYKTHNIQQEQLKKYISILKGKLDGYDEILIFGPGVFKNQFLKHISTDKGFSSVKVNTLDADKMTSNQLLTFVKNHFS
ncbi:hypothetical protein [Algoriphagus marinus]|uniref:hypothetical protein n=1 Tax=Algoriphagus marinus TaxID=1925762 RepID=UPI00094BBF36|nr:hypothetical protein [Algoriphagus marinus]